MEKLWTRASDMVRLPDPALRRRQRYRVDLTRLGVAQPELAIPDGHAVRLRATQANRVFDLSAVGIEFVDDTAIAVDGPDMAVLRIPRDAVGTVALERDRAFDLARRRVHDKDLSG